VNGLTATLSPEEWDYIAKCLGQRPFAEVEGLVNKLRAQLEKPPIPPAEPAPAA
jgi:hypothetical protein